MVDAAAASRAEPPQFEKLKPGPGQSAAVVAEQQCERIQVAMLQIVVDRGYPSVTVRDLVKAAGVSSRTFYERYSGKEECFLRTHESIAGGIADRVILTQTGELAWRASLRLTVDTYLDELQHDPYAARLLLFDAYVAGSVALGQVRQAEQAFETSISDCYGLMVGDLILAPQLARGIAVGIMCIARTRLSEQREPDLTQLTDELTNWAAEIMGSFRSGAGQASALDRLRVLPPSSLPARITDRPEWSVSDERSLIVSALIRLVAVGGYRELTVRKIRGSAGVSLRKFNVHFEGVDDCFQDALDLYTDNVPSYLDVHQGIDSLDWRLEDPVQLLCDSVVRDSALAAFGFVDVVGPGSLGILSLQRFIEGIAELVSGDDLENVAASIAPEASAAAVWGSIREEIIGRRTSRLSKSALLLRILAAASLGATTARPKCKTSDLKI